MLATAQKGAERVISSFYGKRRRSRSLARVTTAAPTTALLARFTTRDAYIFRRAVLARPRAFSARSAVATSAPLADTRFVHAVPALLTSASFTSTASGHCFIQCNIIFFLLKKSISLTRTAAATTTFLARLATRRNQTLRLRHAVAASSRTLDTRFTAATTRTFTHTVPTPTTSISFRYGHCLFNAIKFFSIFLHRRRLIRFLLRLVGLLRLVSFLLVRRLRLRSRLRRRRRSLS